MMQPKTILVAPLHWGLGHATRCIPIIHALVAHNFKVIIASDGAALQLLQKEFPDVTTCVLPSYNIQYPKKGWFFKTKMLLKIPHIIKTISKEKKHVAKLVKQYNIQGIISDNRWGVRHPKVPSVFLTHQLNVLSGSTSKLSSWMHQLIIKKFTQCWVPDHPGPQNLSGILGHSTSVQLQVVYLGPLSRMISKELPKKYDLLLLLSGPEPQRSIFETQLINEFKNDPRSIFMVRGVVEATETKNKYGTITAVNFLNTTALETCINQSEFIICRSGYTTIMDLSVLGKKAFFVPTPGQHEQEYLAKRLQEQGVLPYSRQENFRKEKITEIGNYKGFTISNTAKDFKSLFRLFHSK